jgi:apolipoprotein N-acyltransferase
LQSSRLQANPIIYSALLVFLGVLLAVASELPFSGYIQIVLFAYTLYILNRSSEAKSSQAFWDGFLLGLGYFVIALWWIFISLHDVGGMAVWLSSLAVLALASLMAVYFGLANLIAKQVNDSAWRSLAIPAAWVLSEYLRGQIFTGFPWMGFAESQVNGPFANIAPYLGGLACTFLFIWAALQLSQSRPRNIASVIGMIALVQILGVWSFTSPKDSPISVRLIQGNFEQSLKFNPAEILKQIHFYRDQIIKAPADLIIVPETAFPWPEPDIPDQSIERIQAFVNETDSHVLLGLIGKITKGDTAVQYSNRVSGFSNQQPIYHYDKHHLVPFGEFIPPGFQWFADAFKVPMSDFARGSIDQAPFSIRPRSNPDRPLYTAISICYEDIFGNEIATRIRNSREPVNLLVNVTNLAWFGQSQAPMQQLRLSQLRSLETGLPSLRATNTGITAVIDERGRVTASLPQFVQGELELRVQAFEGRTPYVIWGNWPILIWVLFALGIGYWLKIRPN